MSSTNLDVRAAAKEAKVFVWQIAEAIGVSEPTMTRKLRREMTAEEKERIFSAIDEISAKNNASR